MELTGNLRKQDFCGYNLRGAVFRQADLYQARFAGACLEHAAFVGCFVAEADFERARCREMQAVQSNFYRSCFRSADLTGALLWSCVLARCDLRGATLKRVTLTLDCNSFEEVCLSRMASAKLAYLFGRARSPHRQDWLNVMGDHDLPRLERLFTC